MVREDREVTFIMFPSHYCSLMQSTLSCLSGRSYRFQVRRKPVCLKGQFSGLSSSHCTLPTPSLGPMIDVHGVSFRRYADDTQLYLIFVHKTSASVVFCCNSQTFQSGWRMRRLQLNLSKMDLLVIIVRPDPPQLCKKQLAKDASAHPCEIKRWDELATKATANQGPQNRHPDPASPDRSASLDQSW